MTIDNCALIDSHCHPHFPPLGDDIVAVVADMRKNNVAAALAVATTLAEAATVKKLVADWPGVFYAACGVHPTTAEPREPGADELIGLCADRAVLAVGETGLDFFRQEITEAAQRRRFAAHIAAAKRLKKPLIIHARDSLAATLDMLHAEGAAEISGVLHCFTGDIAAARRGFDMNFMVSFSGIVSFKKADNLRAVARYAPADRYLAETDAPYLAPEPRRGKINAPAYVRHVAAALAVARGCGEAQIAAETTANFRRLFAPPPVAG